MKSRIGNWTLGAILGAGIALAGGPATAQEKFPSRPIEVVIPSPPGGGTDISVRFLAEIIEPVIGQKLVIVNKAGAAGVPGHVSVMQAKPDGYTLGAFSLGQLAIQPHTMAAVPYTPSDFTVISLSSASPAVLCAKADFPANDGKELIALLRANPGKYTYGTDGIGGFVHIAAERIFTKEGVTARAVPFSGGGETLKNFLGGHVDIFGGAASSIIPYVQSGAAKCLIIASAEPNPMMPKATNVTQLGIPDQETLIWRGMFGPKGMPPERVAYLEKVFMDAARSDKFKEFLAKNGEIAMGNTSADSKKRVDKDFADIGVVVKNLGLTKK